VIINIGDLQNDRITLREFRESDVWEDSDAQQIAEISKLLDFPGNNELPQNGLSVEELQKTSKALIAKWVSLCKPDAKTHEREYLKLAITQTSDSQQKIIGYIALDAIYRLGYKSHEISFFIHPAHQRKKFAMDASLILLEKIFKNNTNIKNFFITFPLTNIAAEKIAAKLGFSKFDNDTFLQVNKDRESWEKWELTRLKTLPVMELCNKDEYPNPIIGEGCLGNEFDNHMYYKGDCVTRRDVVRNLQTFLIKLGYNVGESSSKEIEVILGKFGKKTKIAIMNFQQKQKDCDNESLVIDGLVGPRTTDALNRAMKSRYPVCLPEDYKTPERLMIKFV
jgi:RimJ/RimL family protein N-acetyltransferase